MPMIFGLFLCFQATQLCAMQGGSRMTFAGPVPAMAFENIGACERFAARTSGVVAPTGGRVLLPGGMWYECRPIGG